MKALVYNRETGQIQRRISGNFNPEREVLKSNEKILTEDDTEFPDNMSGKKVDVESETIVDDPDYTSQNKEKEEILKQLKSGEISEDNALQRLLEL